MPTHFAPMPEVLYTLGYEKRSIEEFVALARSSGVDVLVDVRETAWSHLSLGLVGATDVGMRGRERNAGTNGPKYKLDRMPRTPDAEQLIPPMRRRPPINPQLVRARIPHVPELIERGGKRPRHPRPIHQHA